MIDFFASATVATIVVMTLVILFSNFRQAKILREMNKVLENWYLAQMRDRKAARRKEIVINDPLNWFGNQINVKIVELQRKLDNIPAVEFITTEGMRLVVSTLSPENLKKALRSTTIRRGKLSRLVEPLLGRNPHKVQSFDRSSISAGEWFDDEAEAALRALEINWGEIQHLWFFLVPVATKREKQLFQVDWYELKKLVKKQYTTIRKWVRAHISKP